MKNRKEKLRIYIEEERERLVEGLKEREVGLKLETELINDIIGPRRSGKTSLMRLEIQRLLRSVERERIIYLNFESRRILPLTPEYFNDIIEIIYETGALKLGKVYLFLDEVQRIDGWERYVRSIYDEFKGRIKIFISGSSSKLTKSKLSHLLSGRHLTTTVFPLNFREYLNFNDVDFEGPFTEERESLIKKHLKDYLTYGGFPEVVLTKNEELIETLFIDIINRDILPHVRNREILEDVAYFLCTNASKLTSFSKLTKLLKSRGVKISVPTLEKYFTLMKDSFLFFDSKIFSYKVKDQLQHPRKIYCVDTGFINYFGFKFSEDAGRLMENLIGMELFKTSYNRPKFKVFYFKDLHGKEVDFVLKEGGKVKGLIQVCYDIYDSETKKREIKALIKAGEELRCRNLSVITWEDEGEEMVNGKVIRFIPLWKWLIREAPHF
ncbi:MAG: hypothetical protein DRP11_02015 [Candidatus Aenigmatarchaeota archaeon]|nr:MAG: hypothetical protein DRP11_02015 [Candidatus Aenigmarchaeota archaeon]